MSRIVPALALLLGSCSGDRAEPRAYEETKYWAGELAQAAEIRGKIRAQVEATASMLDHCTSLPSAEEMRACSADLTAAREDVFGLTNAALGVTLSMWAGMARIEAWCNRGEVNREIENGIAGLVARILEAPGGIDLAKARQRVDSDLEHGRLSVVCEDVAHVHSQIPLKIQRIMKEQEAIAREIRG